MNEQENDNATTKLVFIVLISVVGIFAIGFNCICLWRSNNRYLEWSSHYAPFLPNNSNIRLDGALRDAKESSKRCVLCDFSNSKHRIFCLLCGATLKEPTSENKNTIKILESSEWNNQRQRRARLRKEWVRKIDVDGNMYWYRDGTTLNMNTPIFTGFVLSWTRSTKELIPDTLLDHSTQQGDESFNDDLTEPQDVPPVSKSMEEVKQQLVDELATRDAVVLEANATDPNGYIEGVNRSLTCNVIDSAAMVAHAQLDFPSKLVEFITHTMALIPTDPSSSVQVDVYRDTLLIDSIKLLIGTSDDLIRWPYRIKFADEQGVDAGGLYREWLLLVNEQLVASSTGIFTCVNTQDQSYHLNSQSEHVIGENHLVYCFGAGRCIGRALLEGHPTGFHLSLPLLKIILGYPISFDDLEQFDLDVYKNLKWLLEHDDVEGLGLDFSFCEKVGDEIVVTDLIPNGRTINVTNNNKHIFVESMFKWLMFGRIKHQLYAFLRGLYDVIPPQLLLIFDPEEFDLVLSGSDEVDVDDWKKYTKYTADLLEHPVREWFWSLVREMPNELRHRLLQFTTGSSRVPLGGFSSLTSHDGQLCPFTLNGIEASKENGHLRSHACFNRLDLPRYDSKTTLKTVLMTILNSDVHGFTTE